MNVASLQSSVNQTLQAFAIQLEYLVGVVIQATNSWTWTSPITFTDLQLTLLKVLTLLLFITALLIAYSWHIYGKAINEKFVRQSTSKEIEELKLSVARLKLPREHTPRI